MPVSSVKTPSSSRSPALRGEILDDLDIHPYLIQATRLLEDAIQIPGTKIRFGLDSVIGLVPVVGDLATALFGVFMLREARRLGVSRFTQGRMVANYFLDLLVGAVPVVGDVGDVLFKANRKNLQMLQAHVERLKRRRQAPYPGP